MAHKHKLYMAGKMKGIPKREAIQWAEMLDENLKFNGLEDTYTMHIPAKFYNYETYSVRTTEKEIIAFDLALVRKSDILIVNLKDINNSVGSHFEIATALAENSFGSKHIAIIGLGDTGSVHPWIIESCDKICLTIDELAEYLTDFHLRTF